MGGKSSSSSSSGGFWNAVKSGVSKVVSAGKAVLGGIGNVIGTGAQIISNAVEWVYEKIKGVGDPVYTETAGYPFQKTDEGKELRDKVNKVLGELKDEGFLKETSIKWFGFDPME